MVRPNAFLRPTATNESTIDSLVRASLRPHPIGDLTRLEFERLRSGLFIPRGHAETKARLDEIETYIDATQVFDDVDLGWPFITDTLDQISFANVIEFAAYHIGRINDRSLSPAERDLQFAHESFVGEALSRLVVLINGGNRLLFPQALMVLAKLAIVRCGSRVAAVEPLGLLPCVLLAVAQQLGPHDHTAAANLTLLEREVISNSHFNASQDVSHLTASWSRRWIQLPAEMKGSAGTFDLSELHAEATGSTLEDLATVGLALYSSAVDGRYRVDRSYFAPLGWGEQRLGSILQLLSASRPDLHSSIIKSGLPMVRNGLDWDFSPLERFPLVDMSDGSYIILNTKLLMNRVFGWLPYFDIRSHLRSTARKRAGSFDTFFRRLSEVYIREVLSSVAPNGAGVTRVYHESNLKQAFGVKGVKTADVAIDYGDSWVIVEITTRQIVRETVAGSSDLQSDVDAIIAKCRQLNSTIVQLRSNESRLTRTHSLTDRTFLPIVVATEGFPVNPLLMTRIRNRLKAESILQERDTLALEILTRSDLELIEAAQEQYGHSLRAILVGKSSSDFALASVRTYLLIGLGLDLSPSDRIDNLYRLPFEIAAEELRNANLITVPDSKDL